uniref:4-hydroxyphenylacetaldehyde oxime monooxygenase n=2 Tax=Aegilops tauschii TaxID=37682 RepID=A0A453QCZ7_AEGTS
MDGIVGTVAFGNIYGTEHLAPYREHFHHVIDEAMAVRSSFSAEDYFPNALGRLVDRLTGVASLRERVFKEYDDFFEMMIEQHMDKPDNGCASGLIDVLIGFMKEEHHQGPFRFDRDVVKALLTNTFIGAVDTGAVTIIWAMAELVRNPHVLNKVQEEIRTVVGSNRERVQRDHVGKLKYLKMVVMETLCLHPALPLLLPRETGRHITVSGTVSGYDVPEKTRILVNAWAIGREPVNWDNPEEFIPERFEGKDVNFNRAQFEYLPFGAGRRMCPGIDMGVAITEFTRANLLYYFDLELPEGLKSEDMCMEEAGGLTIHKKTPLLVVRTRYHTSGSMR